MHGDMVDDDEIRQPDTWEVIRKYFDENGLVQQQRASYNEFILQNVQEVIEDYKGQVEVTATQQFVPGQRNDGRQKLQIEFGKVRIAQPNLTEVSSPLVVLHSRFAISDLMRATLLPGGWKKGATSAVHGALAQADVLLPGKLRWLPSHVLCDVRC
eukprot:1670327-Rhodomonas_salina.5